MSYNQVSINAIHGNVDVEDGHPYLGEQVYMMRMIHY